MRTIFSPFSLVVWLVVAAQVPQATASPKAATPDAPDTRPDTPRVPKGFKVYQGPWFNIFYPATFQPMAAPLSKPDPSSKTSDGAFFTSPDKNARFYVFSPLWNGTPADARPQKGETLVSRKVQTSSDTLKSQIVTTWLTIRGPKNSYTRSVVDVENRTLNVRRTYAFEYRDAGTYKKYLPMFTTFKNSLQQFSD